MTDIWLSAVVTEDRKLIVEVPDEVPPGRVDVLIQVPDAEAAKYTNPAREAARAKLAAAGILSKAHELLPDVRIPTDEEVRAAGKLPPGARPSEDLIREDREDRV